MDLSNEGLLVIIGVGVAAGWLGYAVRGTGFGLLSDMAIGALVGDWILPRLNVQLGVGIAAIINAAIGAIARLLIVTFASGGKGSRGGLRSTGSNCRRRLFGRR